MRYRLMASYRGAPFEAGVGPSDRDVVLFAAAPPPDDLDFEAAAGHWRKQLRVADVEALWESRPTGLFRGERCMVLDDLGDRLHITYLGHDAYRAEELGYWQLDRGVFELITQREEVTDVIEERRDYQHWDRANGMAEPEQWRGTDPMRVVGPTAAAAFSTTPIAEPPAYDYGTPGYGSPAPDREPEGSGVLLPPAAAPPLPLEAAALRAAAAAATDREWPPRPQQPAPSAGPPDHSAAPVPRRRTARRRQPTEQMFAELAGLAAIPPSSYAIGTEVAGALCLLRAGDGFEVFSASGGARHEVRWFADEESAYFYLFGVLTAEAVRLGLLGPPS